MRRIVVLVLVLVLATLALGGLAVARGDSSTVTRARIERSLPVVFANRYVEQARIEGRTVTPSSLHAVAMCDKHGAEGADVGPGGDWICLMSWTDPEVPMPPEGYGKFELNVHSNDCYTAAGPSKLTGFLTMTGADGRDVTNPVFEFDGCFDPSGDTAPTGVLFPSLLAVSSTTLTPDADGRVGLQVTCGTGSQGCSGEVTATAGDADLGSVGYDLQEESTATLTLPGVVAPDATEVTFTFRLDHGAGPTSAVTLPVQAG